MRAGESDPDASCRGASTLAITLTESRTVESRPGRFFEWAASSGLTLLSVSHSVEVAKHHTHELCLDASGAALFKPLRAP